MSLPSFWQVFLQHELRSKAAVNLYLLVNHFSGWDALERTKQNRRTGKLYFACFLTIYILGVLRERV